MLTLKAGPRILMNRDAIKLSQKIGVPVLAPNFAVCNRGETDRFLAYDDFSDRRIFYNA